MIFTKQRYTKKQQTCQHTGHQMYQNAINTMQLLVIFIEQKEYLKISMKKLIIS